MLTLTLTLIQAGEGSSLAEMLGVHREKIRHIESAKANETVTLTLSLAPTLAPSPPPTTTLTLALTLTRLPTHRRYRSGSSLRGRRGPWYSQMGSPG